MSNARILLSVLFLSFAGKLPLIDLIIEPADARGEDKKAADEPKAGEEQEFEIAAGVKMKFCWIPSGEAQLGSPKTERDAVQKQLIKDEMEYPALETEGRRGEFQTKGFWLGKYPVTQREWVAVMGQNPSWFDGKKDTKAKGLETSRFPVDNVSWNDCQKFLVKVNGRVGVEKVFGKAGRFVLPHEDQWEYACRGGNGNKRAYYWGDELNGTQANCNGNYPFGTTTKGQNMERTCSVDFTNDGKYAKHPWGLCHMLGNVSQWCDNKYEKSNARIFRGGCWSDSARECRSAGRDYTEPEGSDDMKGFRVCVSLEK
jgi:formylglycine-generating enzyme required for sulfatase activity